MMPIRFIAVLLGLCFCAGSCGLAAEPKLEEAHVVLVFAAGEPGAPVETITLSSAAGGAATIQISRKGGTGEVTQQQPISADEFKKAWDVVVAGSLRTWSPQEEGEVVDFGQQRLKIVWRAAGESQPKTHDVTWARPLKNGQPFERLKEAVAPLARKHLQQVPSLYLQ